MTRTARALLRLRRSIAARLSLTLLAVFGLVLAGIGAHFYRMLDDDFMARARTELEGKAALVRGALGELASEREIAAGGARLEALLAGEHRMGLALLDAQGNVLHASPGVAQAEPALLERLRERAAAGLEGELDLRREDGFLVRMAHAPLAAAGGRVWLAVAHDVREQRAVLEAHGEAMLLALLLGATLAAAGGLWVVRAGLAPLARIARAAERISAERLDSRIRADDVPLEIAGLAQAFNAMLDRLDDSFRRLSDFSSDLAHELRTPANSLLGHAQVALSRPRAAAEYRAALEAVVEEGERMARIIRDMLFLARADDAAARLAKERLDLRAEVEAVSAYFDLLAQERGVRIACEGAAEVRAERGLARRAIGNLLSNALRHAPRGATVRATIRPGSDGAVALEVSNPGPGIPAEHLPRVFDRFYRVERGGGESAAGSGLGLAIVKSIMQLHGGSVQARSAPGGLTTFRVEFPRG